MNNTPNIDVIMAVYNGSNYLEQQIISIYNQSLKPKKLIIRDDLSTDTSIEMLRYFKSKWPEWINLYLGEKRFGIKGNFEELINLSDSPYIALADQDDIWHLNKLRIGYEQCKFHEEIYGEQTPILIHSDLELINHNGSFITQSFIEFQGLKTNKTDLDSLIFQNVITGCSIFMNKALALKALPFPDEAIMHDWWLGLVASEFGLIHFENQQLLSYRQHSGNIIGAKGKGLTYLIYKLSQSLFITPFQKIKLYYFQAKAFYLTYGCNEPRILKYDRAEFKKKILMIIFNYLKITGTFRFIIISISLLLMLPLSLDRSRKNS